MVINDREQETAVPGSPAEVRTGAAEQTILQMARVLELKQLEDAEAERDQRNYGLDT